MAGIPLFRKLYFFSLNKGKGLLAKLHLRRRRKTTKALREKGESDLNRWKNPDELDESWDERTYILASFIKPGARVIEFGAGNLSLKTRLPVNCLYQASDIVCRYPDVIKCDLNEEIQIDMRQYDTTVFSGVLEYVYNIESVFAQISNHIENIVLSYACSDISNADRLENGWLSDYKKAELEKIFVSYNYRVINYKEWRNQSIYCLKKNNN
ncbi:hypothetical protein [Salegentibacter sp. F14]